VINSIAIEDVRVVAIAKAGPDIFVVLDTRRSGDFGESSDFEESSDFALNFLVLSLS
jgi:hypothetical protein